MNERHTRQLEAAYEAVHGASDHPTAGQVHARVRRKIARVSLGTVYRNLQKLTAQGRIRMVHLGPRSTRFDGMLDLHDHFLCERCGALTDLPPNRRTPPDVRGLQRAGYGVARHALTVFGRCPSCRATETRRATHTR